MFLARLLFVTGLGLSASTVSVACAEAVPGASDASTRRTRATMQEIFEALSSVLPLSLSEKRFADPANRSVILAPLETLSRNASRLEKHGQQLDAGFAYLSRSLARDARNIHRWFEADRVPEAQFLLQQLTENCIACHTRLPDRQSSRLAERLFGQAEIQDLPLAERARLEVAVRRFDDAIRTYERLFFSETANPVQLDLEGHFTDYLVVCIRVKGEMKRPHATFEKLSRRRGLPLYLRRDFGSWVDALHRVERIRTNGSELDRARALVQEARALLEFPTDRAARVHHLVASAHLHRFVSSRSQPSRDVAEAYYLLGITESAIHTSFWLSQTDFYLETAIRLAPGEPFAKRAYALLEEQTIAGYSGSAGVYVPPDVQQHLDDLRSLVEDR